MTGSEHLRLPSRTGIQRDMRDVYLSPRRRVQELIASLDHIGTTAYTEKNGSISGIFHEPATNYITIDLTECLYQAMTFCTR